MIAEPTIPRCPAIYIFESLFIKCFSNISSPKEILEKHLMNKDSKIYIAGHRGMVGSAIIRRLQKDGFTNIVTRNSNELDLRNQQAVADFFANEKPEYV